MLWNKIKKLFGKQVREEFRNRLILCIDDNEVDRRWLERILIKREYRVLPCSNGEAGLDMALKEKPDLILLDIVLPGINGIEVCKRLKKNEETKNIPIIFLTGMDTPKNLIDCYEYGAEDFLNKSISPSLLIHQIELTLQDFIPSKGNSGQPYY